VVKIFNRAQKKAEDLGGKKPQRRGDNGNRRILSERRGKGRFFVPKKRNKQKGPPAYSFERRKVSGSHPTFAGKKKNKKERLGGGGNIGMCRNRGWAGRGGKGRNEGVCGGQGQAVWAGDVGLVGSSYKRGKEDCVVYRCKKAKLSVHPRTKTQMGFQWKLRGIVSSERKKIEGKKETGLGRETGIKVKLTPMYRQEEEKSLKDRG